MQKLDPKAVWLFFFSSIASCLILLIIFGFWIFVATVSWSVAGSISDLGFGVIILLFIVAFLIVAYVWARLSYHYYRYELTDMGFRKELGVIWKRYVTIPYDRIQNVDIYRGVLARLLGLSDLNIQTAGATSGSGRSAFSEGRLPGLSRTVAEQLRDELVLRARNSKHQGL
ncbi:MAG: PH domain-containing protein [Patescibacteria group bacterium]